MRGHRVEALSVLLAGWGARRVRPRCGAMDTTNGSSVAPDPTAQRDRNRELYDLRVAALARLAEAESTGNRVAARRAKAEADNALAALHSENQRLVAYVCRPFHSDDDRQAYRDYLEAGSLALFEAILSWDPAKAKLGYWSTKHVRKAVFKEVARREHRLSRHAFAVRKEVHAAVKVLRERLDRSPTNEEVSEESGLPIGVVSRIREADTRGADPSLDAPIGDDGLTLADVLGTPGDDTAGESLDLTRDEIKVLTAAVKVPAIWCGLLYYGMNQTWRENHSAVGAITHTSREPPRKLAGAFTAGVALAMKGDTDADTDDHEPDPAEEVAPTPAVLDGQGQLFQMHS